MPEIPFQDLEAANDRENPPMFHPPPDGRHPGCGACEHGVARGEPFRSQCPAVSLWVAEDFAGFPGDGPDRYWARMSEAERRGRLDFERLSLAHLDAAARENLGDRERFRGQRYDFDPVLRPVLIQYVVRQSDFVDA